MTRSTRSATTPDERGAGLLSTSFGVGVFLVFVLFAVQLLINLYAASVVTSATYDAARQVATTAAVPPTDGDLAAAENRARQLLGRYGQRATFEWQLDDPDVIRLRVRVPNPRVLAPGIDQLVGLDVIDRTTSVRVERPR